MIQEFSLADMRKMVASRPMGWPRFTVGDLHHANGERRLAKAYFRDRMRKRYYTATSTGPIAVAGAVWTWSDTTGTFALTLNALAAAAARQGVKSTTTTVAPPNTGTNPVPPVYFSTKLTIQIATGTPVTGDEIQLYFSFSPSVTAGTSNPGNTSGTDSGYTNLTALPQMLFAGSFINAADLTASVTQNQFPFAIPNPDPSISPYMMPVVYNKNTTLALKASNDVSFVTVVPYWYQTAP